MTVKIGKRIKALRKRDDVTQDKLAEVLGVTSQAISKWENETGYPDIEYIAPIANFFNVTIDELFDHDKAEKEHKINAYCEQYDAMYRSWESVDERIDIMRQALAEYPAEEKLLIRLATALWYKWKEGDFDRYSKMDGKWVHDFDKFRAHEGWQEPVKIMEELLATSVDDTVRSECREILPYIYGAIGEKEKVYRIAEYCPKCKDKTLFAAFSGIYPDEARACSQSLLMHALWLLGVHLPAQTDDLSLQAKAYENIIGLYQFVFYDGNYEFYNARLTHHFISYAEVLLKQGKTDEAIAVLEKAYEHARQFDISLDKLRRDGEVRYTSVFMDAAKDISDDVYATKQLPELLNCTLLDKNDIIYQKLSGEPRFIALIKQIEGELR